MNDARYNTKEISNIKNYMIKQGHTLSVAESVTSGHIQAALSLADGATEFFQGGITAYNLGQKARHLKIDPIHALKCNCVERNCTGDGIEFNHTFFQRLVSRYYRIC